VSSSYWPCAATAFEAVAEVNESGGIVVVDVVDAVDVEAGIEVVVADVEDVLAELVVCVLRSVVVVASETMDDRVIPQSKSTIRRAASSPFCMMHYWHTKEF
jgi:hypothetical protein